MFLDCCRDRRVNTGGRGSRLRPPRADDAAGNVQTYIAFATEFQSAAHEALVKDTGTEETPVVRGYFSQALMDGLRGAAAHREGGVPAARLAEYLEWRVPSLAREENCSQFPRFIDGFIQARGRRLILGNARPTVNVRLRFGPKRKGRYQLIGPHKEIIREGDVSGDPWELHLDSGSLYVMGKEDNHYEIIEFPTGEGVHDVTF